VVGRNRLTAGSSAGSSTAKQVPTQESHLSLDGQLMRIQERGIVPAGLAPRCVLGCVGGEVGRAERVP
jgi:hypothetical protein